MMLAIKEKNERTCFLINGGKNSNNADAQGERREDILSEETPSPCRPWISYNNQDITAMMNFYVNITFFKYC